MELFNLNSPLMRGINKVIMTIYIGMLWFLCSIPIITIGASTAAMYEVLLKMAKDLEGNITKDFFRGFRNNLKQGVCIWLVFLVAFAVLLGNLWFYGVMDGARHFVLVIMFLVMLVLTLTVCAYIFPVMARTENSVKGHFQIALILTLRNPGWSVLLFADQLLTLFLIYLFAYAPILFLMGPMGYLQGFVFNYIFDRLLAKGMISEEKTEYDCNDKN